MHSNLFRFLLAALLATTPLWGHGDDTGHDHADHIEELSAEVPEVAPIEVSQADLIEMIGYLTAQGGGVPMLELSEADIAMLADGLNMGLSGEFDVMAIAQTELQAAFAEAQARAEAVEGGAEELPAFSEGSLKKIGAVMVMQSGLEQLGFGAEDADQITAGFIAGASAKEMDPSFEAKLPAFQAFIQERIQAAQADMMRAQEAALQEAMAEFESYAAEWKEKENFNIVLQTTQGDVTIELMPSVAPLAVANFVGHIENGYYDGLTFHRIIKDFMIQGGDPVGNGTGGESIWGKNFPDEFSPDVRFDTEGLLAMANSGPMTNGSQFFITTSTPEWLNDKHTIFGKVVEGYENVEKLEGVETGAQDVPVEAQAIIKAYVVE
ncbi:MAG: peptidylprolyl isomerase [Opitutales bacterium]